MATVKGGYDCDFVGDPPKSLECTICLLTLRDPHVISCCGNHFCRPCIERVQRDKKPCPLCNEPSFNVFLHKGVMREVNALLVRCPQKALGCAWEGVLGQVQRHLEPGAGLVGSGCAYVEVVCANGCGGRFLRGEVRAHELEVCPRRPLEVVMASIVKRLDALTAENQAMKAENQQLKAELTANKQEVVQLRQDLEIKAVRLDGLATKAEVTQIKDGLATKAEVTKLKDGLATKAEVTKLKDRLATKAEVIQLKDGLATKAELTHTPPFYFKMYNYKHFKSVDYEWHSEPLYTHAGGYKMRVEVHPGGRASAKGTHLSLFVQIMQEGNDDQLQWPFRGSLTVQAFNWKAEVWDRIKTVTFDESTDTTSGKKPLAQYIGNVGHGFVEYIPHNEMECYAENDIITFCVTMPK